jgi:hypothetical protein
MLHRQRSQRCIVNEVNVASSTKSTANLPIVSTLSSEYPPGGEDISLPVGRENAAATALAAKGFPVLKLSDSRRPIHKRFWEKASKDPDKVKLMWTNHDGEPSIDNIGVLTGGELIVIDIDVKKGAQGHESLAALELIGLSRDTFTVRTTSVNEQASQGYTFTIRFPRGFGKIASAGGKVSMSRVITVTSWGRVPKKTESFKIEQNLPVAELPEMFQGELKSKTAGFA